MKDFVLGVERAEAHEQECLVGQVSRSVTNRLVDVHQSFVDFSHKELFERRSSAEFLCQRIPLWGVSLTSIEVAQVRYIAEVGLLLGQQVRVGKVGVEQVEGDLVAIEYHSWLMAFIIILNTYRPR